MAEPFYVLFRDGTPDDWVRAAQVLDAASPTLTRGDATRICRFGSGLIPAPLPESEALQVAGALDRAGFPTVLLPYHSLVRAPAPFVLPNADAYSDGLHIQVDLKGTMQTLPWAALSMVSIECIRPQNIGKGAMVAIDVPRVRPRGWDGVAHRATTRPISAAGFLTGFLMPDIPGAITRDDPDEGVVCAHASDPESAQPLPPEVWLELFALKPLMRLRIRQTVFNYDYLAERLTTNSRLNFALLIRDILKFAPNAAKVGQIGPALAGKPLDHPKKILEHKDYELAVTALLTREAIVGLPRYG